MTRPEFPRKSASENAGEHGAVGSLSPSELGPLVAPWIPPKQQSKSPGGAGKPITVSWCGSVPSSVDSMAVWEVPYNADGSSMTFNLARAMMRLETPGSGSTTAVMERAAGGDIAFGSPTTEASITIAATHYEGASSGLSGTISSGDLIRLRFTAVGAAGSDFTATLTGST